MVGRIIEAVRRLPELPLSGRVVPEWDRAVFRGLIVYPYRIVYTVSSKHVAMKRPCAVWPRGLGNDLGVIASALRQ
jgi:hypothetical protein